MILSAMIFAAVTTVVGFIVGFLLGQARSRMNYEAELRKAQQERALFESQLAELRASLSPKAGEQPSGAASASRAAE